MTRVGGRECEVWGRGRGRDLVYLDGPRLRDGEEEAADGGRDGEEICSTKPVLAGGGPRERV